MTKIETRIELKDGTKAEMIAAGIKIPSQDTSFEMSPQYASIFTAKGIEGRNLIVRSDESIYIEKLIAAKIMPKAEIRNGIDDKDGSINTTYLYPIGIELSLSDLLIPDLKSGSLIPGMNIDTYLDKINAQRLSNIALIQKQDDEVKAFPTHAPQREAAKKVYEDEKTRIMLDTIKKNKAEQEIKDIETKKQDEAKKARRLSRLAWAQEHGSNQLRKGLEQGYSCIKVYEEEYGVWVLGNNYVWDRNDVVEEKDRSCPSLEALEIVEVLVKDERIGNRNADIKWLPDGLSALVADDDHWDEDTKKGCEAISVGIKGITGLWYKVMA